MVAQRQLEKESQVVAHSMTPPPRTPAEESAQAWLARAYCPDWHGRERPGRSTAHCPACAAIVALDALEAKPSSRSDESVTTHAPGCNFSDTVGPAKCVCWKAHRQLFGQQSVSAAPESVPSDLPGVEDTIHKSAQHDWHAEGCPDDGGHDVRAGVENRESPGQGLSQSVPSEAEAKAIVERLWISAQSLEGMAEADHELAPYVVSNQNSVTLGITATLEQAAKDCNDARDFIERLAARIAELEGKACDVCYGALDRAALSKEDA